MSFRTDLNSLGSQVFFNGINTQYSKKMLVRILAKKGDCNLRGAFSLLSPTHNWANEIVKLFGEEAMISTVVANFDDVMAFREAVADSKGDFRAYH